LCRARTAGRINSESCLRCHDGSASAPDVLGASASANVRAAGALDQVGDAGMYHGHSLGSTDPAPGGTWSAPSGLGCADCHDAAGNSWYRNLRPDRGGAADVDVSFAAGAVWATSRMAVEAVAAPVETRYDAANVRYGADQGKTLGDWCAGCHVAFAGAPGSASMGGSAAGDLPSSSGDEWMQHPVGGIAMGTVRTTGRVDATHWWSVALQCVCPLVAGGGAVPTTTTNPSAARARAHGSGCRPVSSWTTTQRSRGGRRMERRRASSVTTRRTAVTRTRRAAVLRAARTLRQAIASSATLRPLPAQQRVPALCSERQWPLRKRRVSRRAVKSYPGLPAYAASSHGGTAALVWPVLRRQGDPADRNKCVNAHAAWARRPAGLVPPWPSRAKKSLCAACHGAGSATDVMSSFAAGFRHPIAASESIPPARRRSAAFGAGRVTQSAQIVTMPLATNATHAPGADGIPPASGRLAGVSGVRAGTASAGQPRPYTYIPAGVATEHELCYKCHSSWTTLPVASEDLALLFNPANPSFHPVEARGNNPGLRWAPVNPEPSQGWYHCPALRGCASGLTLPYAGLAHHDPGRAAHQPPTSSLRVP
jgi:hypothetical protein